LWEVKIAIGVQVALMTSLLLEATGYSVPLLRQIVGFVFITAIPGMLLIKILRVDLSSKITRMLVVVGLSIAFVVSVELVANALYPLVGITTPLSVVPMEATLLFSTTILCVLAYIRRDISVSLDFWAVGEHFSKRDVILCLFLLSLSVLSILGATQITIWDNNVITLVFLAILPIVPILVGFNAIREKLYPFAIVTVAVSLLFHNSLISNYLVEWADVSWEYYFSNQVLTNSIWNSAISSNFNAATSIVILAPVFAQTCSMSLSLVFKILYPLLYALVPLGIYQVVRKQTDEKAAFLASFLFAATYHFFTGSLGQNRFQVAALFFVLFLLVITEESTDLKKVSLSIVFSLFVIVSHYALASIFFVIVVLSLLITALMPKWRAKIPNFKSFLTFGLLYSVAAFAWFMNVSNGSVLRNLASIVHDVPFDFFTHFLDLSLTQGLQIVVAEPKTPLLQITKGLYLVAQILIAIGVLKVLLIKRLSLEKIRINSKFLLLSLGSFVVAFAGLIVPHWAATLNTIRLYHIGLLFLAPFCIIGGITAFLIIENLLSKIFGSRLVKNRQASAIKVLSIFFAMYLIFSTGLVFELSGQPVSFSLLSLSRPDAWRAHFDATEIKAATWLNDHRAATADLRGDFNSAHLLMMVSGIFYPLKEDANGTIDISSSNNSYILLGKEVVVGRLIRFPNIPGRLRGNFTLESFLANSTFYGTLMECNKVFDNGDAWVLYKVVG
jgi:uncharacterized membrane protein